MDESTSTYTSRLATFRGYWEDSLTAARQLAALGHVCDRPPLESLEPGSRCISCGSFVPKDLSLLALDPDVASSLSSASSSSSEKARRSQFRLHNANCTRLQLRFPIEHPCSPSELSRHGEGLGQNVDSIRARWEDRIVIGRSRASNADATTTTTNSPSSIARASPSHQSQDQQTHNHQGKISLFSLPPELRLQIYSLVLPCSKDPVTHIAPLYADSHRVITRSETLRARPRDATATSLLRTCRDIHSEALDLLYGSGGNKSGPAGTRAGTFRFQGTKTLFLFLRAIGAAGRRCVRSVDIKAGDREDAVAFALLGSCQRLEKLVLRLPRRKLLLNRAPLWVREGVACLLALRGLREVRFEGCESSWGHLEEGMEDARVVRECLMKPGDEDEI